MPFISKTPSGLLAGLRERSDSFSTQTGHQSRTPEHGNSFNGSGLKAQASNKGVQKRQNSLPRANPDQLADVPSTSYQLSSLGWQKRASPYEKPANPDALVFNLLQTRHEPVDVHPQASVAGKPPPSYEEATRNDLPQARAPMFSPGRQYREAGTLAPGQVVVPQFQNREIRQDIIGTGSSTPKPASSYVMKDLNDSMRKNGIDPATEGSKRSGFFGKVLSRFTGAARTDRAQVELPKGYQRRAREY